MAQNKNQDREAREARERLKLFNARQAVHTHQVSRRRRDNIYAIAGVVVIAALAAVTQIFYFSGGPGAPVASPSASASASSSASAETNVGNIPLPSVAASRTWTGDITLNTTKLGISLDGVKAPQAAASVITDIQSGYYVGKTCHRLVVQTTFGVIQCGSIDGAGGADNNYSFGPVENAPASGIYPKGTIAMARGTSDYSNGHQFFICFKDTNLGATGSGYTVVGTVTSGLDELVSGIVAGGTSAASLDGPPNIATSITAASIQ